MSAVMLGINYESSDDEDVVPAAKLQEKVVNGQVAASPKPAPAPVEEPPAQSGPVSGPAQGPTRSPSPPTEVSTIDAVPGSHYTSTRSLIRNLTLPTVPNFNIPPSPPGSPPQRPTKKFAQFLELKKKGQHFNQRLENSSVLRDPGHLRKLMDFAGIDEEEQYASTLSGDAAVPAVFPQWAYVEQLTASQKKIMKAKEDERARVPREAIDFVPAARSGTSSGTATPSGRVQHRSAAERVMAGLNKDRQQSGQGPGKRKELEQRGGRGDHFSKSTWRSRSRSPKRRRSRSR